jgi:hypothetical protein
LEIVARINGVKIIIVGFTFMPNMCPEPVAIFIKRNNKGYGLGHSAISNFSIDADQINMLL